MGIAARYFCTAVHRGTGWNRTTAHPKPFGDTPLCWCAPTISLFPLHDCSVLSCFPYLPVYAPKQAGNDASHNGDLLLWCNTLICLIVQQQCAQNHLNMVHLARLAAVSLDGLHVLHAVGALGQLAIAELPRPEG